MKKNILCLFMNLIFALSLSVASVAQAPTLGTSANFVLFTTVGAITNTGTSHLTGNVGSNSGSSTGFGNIDGVMHDQDPASAQASADLLIAYNQLNATIPTLFPGILLGNGQTLTPGIYSSPAPTTLNLTLNLDAQGDPNAVFIFKINGTFSTGANAKVNLLNGAVACNVFWQVEGLVSMATGTTMRGTIIANNAAIVMNAADTLEGRALSTGGAISIDGTLARIPLGCATPILTGPGNPVLGTTECFILFSGIGPVTNTGVTTLNGDVGTNSGLTTGFNPLFVTGTIHPVPDGTTSQCGTDFTAIYNNLNTLPYDIELLYPAQFGNNLELTPHTYLMNGAVSFTDTLYLNAQGNANAVFIIQINGAFGTSTYSNVVLKNGAQAKNVYWKIDGAVDINDYSIFCGTIISQGAININTGVTLNGRALTGVGAINTTAIIGTMPTSCAPSTVTQPLDQIACIGSSASFSIVATGIGLTYQWRKGAVNLTNGGSISGATTATLTINPVALIDAANNYNVIITGTFVPSDTSNFVSLTIGSAPIITTQPTDVSACIGDSIAFNVIASGIGNTYQWRKGLVNLIDGVSISGSNTATLSIDPISALDADIDYNVVVAGGCTPDAISNNVSLIIGTTPIISTQPTDVSGCIGDSIAFNVIASGTGNTYQWRRGLINLVNGATISGAQTPTLSINPASALDTGIDYNVVVTGTCPTNMTSNDVSLTLNNCFMDLGITKTASTMSPIVLTNVTFTITATNNGGIDATNAQVTEMLMNGYIFVSYTTTAGTYDPITGVWTIGNLNAGSQVSFNIVATVASSGDYSNTVVISSNEAETNLANNTATITLTPNDFFIPEGFSPNNDLVNDVFVIRGIFNYPNNNFTVFNRWGVLVFEATNYQNNWNGTSTSIMNIGGNILPVGTYFYLLDLGDGSAVFKGTIYLNN